MLTDSPKFQLVLVSVGQSLGTDWDSICPHLRPKRLGAWKKSWNLVRILFHPYEMMHRL